MCGLAGFYNYRESSRLLPSRHELELMTASLVHRGPDDSGVIYEPNIGLGLGHRRLSIRDLSPLGAQPMCSSCGRFWIAYNGEIYSDKELRAELLAFGRKPKGTSDTALLAEAFGEWGVEKTLPKLNGMFAIAAFDMKERTLHLIRDRLGIKPLYWGFMDDTIIFGSELKAFVPLSSWKPTIDRNSLASFMRHNYVPAPHTIYKNTYKLEPGARIEIKKNKEPIITRYWDFLEIACSAKNNLKKDDPKEIVNELDTLLLDAVKRRMVSDVPIGTLLSGGIDSSTVTALMADNSPARKIKTFSIGFSEEGYDEAPYAKAIAAYLGTEHTELYAQPSDAISLVDKMPTMYDEPFADSSQIPTALVSILTRKYVTVVLSGDGGDELFAGYNRYNIGYNLANRMNGSPELVRKLLSQSLQLLPTGLLDKLGHRLPSKFRINQLGQKIKKVALLTKTEDLDAIYREMVSHWNPPEEIVKYATEHRGALWSDSIKKSYPNFLDRMQALDTVTYLPDDILTKVDRASMAIGLEARIPLLDYRVVELAWSIPRDIKIFRGVSKWPLREILCKRVPRHLIDRPKMGFGVPIESWLRGPLKDWSNDLLNDHAIRDQDYFNPDGIKDRWHRHQKGENWAYPLWNVLMFQSWLKKFQDNT